MIALCAVTDLHSNMDRLKRERYLRIKKQQYHLHSNMDVLKLPNGTREVRVFVLYIPIWLD